MSTVRMQKRPPVMRPFSGESCSQMRFDDLFFWCSQHPLSRNQGSEHQILHCHAAAPHPPRSVLVTRFVLARSTMGFSLSWTIFFCCLTLLLQSSAMSTRRDAINFTQALYQSTLHKHFIQALYTSTLSKHFIQALYQSTLSKHFIKVFLKQFRNTCQGITKVLRQGIKTR